MNILGIHGGVSINQHDPAAALMCDGELIACVEEERLMRIKSPRGLLPIHSIQACLDEAKMTLQDINLVVHPGSTYLDMPQRIENYLKHYFGCAPKIEMLNHQLCHLASAFYHSGFDEAMCLSYDAYGDRLSAVLASGDEHGIAILQEFDNTNSLGVFYATITSFLGFLPAEDEYKIMGLAAFGEPEYDLSDFAQPTAEGYCVNNQYLNSDPAPKSNWEPFYSAALVKLLGEPRRKNEAITQRHKNIAYAAQQALRACALSLVERLHTLNPSKKLCMAGGVALNCAVNQYIADLPFVDSLFVQPAASDRGLALGAALEAAKQHHERLQPLRHVYYGPSYSQEQIESVLQKVGVEYTAPGELYDVIADALVAGQIIGWFQGRSEFGPRALGHRSILADPRSVTMRDKVNHNIKYREEFRPFAPAVLEEHAQTLFQLHEPSPYMTKAARVHDDWKESLGATTHVDGTARVQTVSKQQSPQFYQLIEMFYQKTGVPALLNTSFNVKGQPIVESAFDALSTFYASGLDVLVLGPFVVKKNKSCI